MRTVLAVLAACLIPAAPALAQTERSPSLYEKRLSIINGTTPGIVLIPARPGTQAPAGAASSASAAGGRTPGARLEGDAPAAAAGGPSLLQRLGAMLGAAPPPSGRPLSAAKRLDAPDQGIALPTAGRAASQPGRAP